MATESHRHLCKQPTKQQIKIDRQITYVHPAVTASVQRTGSAREVDQTQDQGREVDLDRRTIATGNRHRRKNMTNSNQ
jgi:hypothetical protein